VGELARASPRACGGDTGDEGGRLRDASVADTRHQGLVITRRPPRPRCHCGAPGGGGLASAPPAHFNEAQAEQALWKESRDHGASLNNALNEALRIHTGPAWQIFKVHVLIMEFEVFPCRFCVRAFPDFTSSRTLSVVDRSWRAGLERGIIASIS
jgi:hypothetical protein